MKPNQTHQIKQNKTTTTKKHIIHTLYELFSSVKKSPRKTQDLFHRQFLKAFHLQWGRKQNLLRNLESALFSEFLREY